MLYSKHYKALELHKILALLAEHAVAEQTKANALAITPKDSYEKALAALEQTGDAQSLSIGFGNPGFLPVEPCEQKVQRARVYAALSMRELREIASLLRVTRILKTWRRGTETETTSLDGLFEALTPVEDLEENIFDAILSDDEVADDASSELRNIRRKITNANARARQTLERITRSSEYEPYLQEQIITIRNGRFVVPVRSEHKQEIRGLVHDTSGSGATLFIEPMAVVELNNTIKELEAAQSEEIHRILLAFSSEVAEYGDQILSNYEVILELDLIFAKAKLANKMMAGPIALTTTGETTLLKARHPLIPKDEIVPIDIRIGGEFDTLVITGPNTGGKTVALKTLGLLTLMAMCGLLPPCGAGSSVRFYTKVLADIGDEQSIEQSLSTFSSHMTNIISILEHADQDSLVLIDELGAGTDPVEGAALAVAILDDLRSKHASIVATTHYAELKMYALQTDGVENASCEFDIATLKPTYRLLIGTLGKSNAFAISLRLGLPEKVVEEAQNHVSGENKRFEDVVASLEQARQELEREKEIAETLREKAEETKKDTDQLRTQIEEEMKEEYRKAQETAQGIVAQVRFQYDEVMKELEELRKEQRRASMSSSMAEARGDLRRQLREMEDTAHSSLPKEKDTYKLPRPLKQGDTVFLTQFNTEGTVLSVPDNRGNVRVRAGILETKVPVKNVRLVEERSKVTINGGQVSRKRAKSDGGAPAAASSELDLRGLDSNEAILEVGRFIDRAVLGGQSYVSIIHGKGTGVLRSAVQDYLRTHPSVANYRLGDFGEGGSGVTIAELK